jgi:manganese-dependent ADP-ribose/CDP-alcohol diphosphatase
MVHVRRVCVYGWGGRAGQHVVVFTHVPLYPQPDCPECLLWNYEEVLGALHAYEGVVATFAGHTHTPAALTDDHGVLHYVLDSPLEATPGTDSFATVEVFEDRMRIIGAGANCTLDVRLRGRPSR